MADRKISDLTALTTTASGDYVPIVDISEAAAASKNKRVTIQSLFQGIPGNVGIGISSPSQKLHVSGGDTTNVGFNGTTKGVRFDFDGTQASIFGVDNTFFASYQPLRIGGSITQFMYGGTEAARIDSSGRMGIGTTSPSSGLHLANATAGSSANFTLSNPANNWSIRTGTTDNALVFVENQFSSEKVRITSAGNVGIGTSSPATLLDVNADTVRVRTARTPASASATGATGEICWDANYIYVCTATNTWKRSALSTW